MVEDGEDGRGLQTTNLKDLGEAFQDARQTVAPVVEGFL